MPRWPYPFWIAHRGGGCMAPENTLAAFRVGAAHGYRAFECDVKLSADGVPFLLHDTTLERTTNGHGRAASRRWTALSRLDAGSWYGSTFAGEPPATLQAVAAYLRANGLLLNLEIKPTEGAEHATGAAVAQAVSALWHRADVPPLLSSFKPDALRAAQATAPSLPRALLLDTLWDGWFEAAQDLHCAAIVTHHPLMDPSLRQKLDRAGLHALCYTVNDAADAERLLALGIDGLITDAVDRFNPQD